MDNTAQQLMFFSTLLQLETKARHAKSKVEIFFLLVNETIRLLKYNQAILWQFGTGGRARIKAVSGVDRPDRNAPFILYMRELIYFISKQYNKNECQVFTISQIPEQLHEGWQEWNLGNILWCPITTPSGKTLCHTIFTRPNDWQESEIALLQRLSESYAHALAALRNYSNWFKLAPGWVGKKIIQIAFIVAVVLIMDLPVRLSAVAPVEITPSSPRIVSTPINGIVNEFFVKPGEPIKKGQKLFTLDDTTFRNEYQVNKKALAVIEAEEKRIRQKAFGDPESRAQILHMESTIVQKKAELDYLRDLLEQTVIKAEQDGIAVFTDPNDWLGRPVTVGEKILSIANPNEVHTEIMLPVEDAINLQRGAEVLVFLNIKPDAPLKAELTRSSYEADITADGILAFKLIASLKNSNPPPRIGLRGTAKIYGKEVPLYYYILRRPLVYVRQLAGV